MKSFILSLIVILLVAVAGCLGDDGDDDLDVAPSETDGVSDTGTTAVVLDRGTGTVPGGPSQVSLTTISVSEPGTLEGRITWNGGPDELSPGLMHAASLSTEAATGSSPIFVYMEVTQALLDQGHDWYFNVVNTDPSPADVEYRVRFTPDN